MQAVIKQVGGVAPLGGGGGDDEKKGECKKLHVAIFSGMAGPIGTAMAHTGMAFYECAGFARVATRSARDHGLKVEGLPNS